MKRFVLYIMICVALAGCEPTLVAEFEDRPVIRCYLDAGHSPVLKLSKLIAFRDDVTYSDEDINGQNITIRCDDSDESYTLSCVGEGVYENPQLIIQAGKTYTLEFTYNGESVTATTTVPEAPADVEFSATSIGIMNFTPPSAPSARAMPGNNSIDITWENDGQNYYIIEGVTSSTTQVSDDEDDDSEDDSDTETPAQYFRMDYTQGNSASLSQMQFSYYGDYEVSLIRILPEYVVMTQSSSNSSSSLEDVRGNISGGYGIFSGINRVSKVINVYRQSSDVNPW